MVTTAWMKFFYEYLLEDEQELSVGDMLTVYFGTPNMFIELWFGFVYGTNMDIKDIFATSSNEHKEHKGRIRNKFK
jgi:hypothetical protein